ncbi:hypothetical protein [Xanthobacter sp. ZOL 2024]
MAGSVSVACKLPNGLALRVFRMIPHIEKQKDGSYREIETAAQMGDTVTLKGYAAPFGMAPNAPVAGGYAITSGVDADFWAAWLEQNAEHPVVKNGLVFASERIDSVQKQAKEQAEIKCGLEALDPDKPMRGIAKADSKAA